MIGIGRDQWRMVAAALTLGGSIRVGLEDNFYLPDGQMARSNGDLIAKARQMVQDCGRRPATVAEARALLGIAAAVTEAVAGDSAGPSQASLDGEPGQSGSDLPLAGLTVLDLSRLLPGGFCSLLLADFGADVIKVEDTGVGDYIRWSPPYYDGAADTAKSALFLSLNRGKRSIRLNLKTDGGREALLRLARDADVLLESFRPAVLDRLGVGYERLRQENPGLVYCAISGYGQDGPNRDRSGHDMNYLGLNGLLGLTGEADGPPVQAAAQIADLGGGALMAAVGILVALRERERSGEGQFVDCSMFDGALSWLAMLAAEAFATGRAPGRGELGLAGRYNCYRPYECADGYVTLGALEPKFWQAWCDGVGRPDLAAHAFDSPGSESHAAVEAIFRRAPVTSGARSRPSTTAAWSRSSGSTRRSPRSWWRRGRWSWSWRSPAPSARSSCWGSRSSSAGRRGMPRAHRARSSASTPMRCWPRPASRPPSWRRCTRGAPSPAPTVCAGRS